jgi:hypothetical protein
MAVTMQQPEPTDAQVSYFLGDADDVVDDFDPPPVEWMVENLPDLLDECGDPEPGVDAHLLVNGREYVALEGGKDCRGNVVAVGTWRSWFEEENRG